MVVMADTLQLLYEIIKKPAECDDDDIMIMLKAPLVLGACGSKVALECLCHWRGLKALHANRFM